jgi:nucleotide-binding universal stress UspA family protein
MGNLTVSAPIGFKNILFATDFSSTTELALPYALQIARRSGGTLHAVHVIQPDIYPLVPPSEWSKMAQEEKEFRERKKNELEQAFQGIPHEFLLPSGDVWDKLENIIEDQDIDLVVLGTHGRTGLRKILLGSVAEKVFRKAVCPVLTVGPAVASKAKHAAAAEFNRILYATDFSPESLAAAPYAVCVAKENRAQLILMHAIQSEEPGHVDTAYQTLRDVVPSGANLEFKPRLVVEPGAPHAGILGVAARHDVDLIVLGVRRAPGNPAVVARFPHSIVYDIMVEAACPVLTVRG